MAYTMLVQTESDIFDISSLSHSIHHFTDLNGQAGKLTFLLEKDPYGELQLACGDKVRFNVDNEDIFIGYIFTMGTDGTEAYKVTAYDQTRYLKNKDIILLEEGKTASDLFTLICTKANISNYKVVTKSNYALSETTFFPNKTYFDMLDTAITETLQGADGNPYYFVRDNKGVLEFNELSSAKTDIIIGDESLMTSYQYELDIDKDTCNRIMVLKGSEKDGYTYATVKQDEKNILKWGLLQDIITVDNESTDAYIQDYAKAYLELKNRVNRTLKISALGSTEIIAGSGFLFELPKLGLRRYMYVISADHSYDSDLHTMELEVSGFTNNSNEIIPSLRKSDLEIAEEVIDGKWGVGAERKMLLTEAGYDYNTIQIIINDILL